MGLLVYVKVKVNQTQYDVYCFVETDSCVVCRMLDNIDEETNETAEVTSFVSDSPSLGLWCRFRRSAEKIIWNTLFWIMSMAVGNVNL